MPAENVRVGDRVTVDSPRFPGVWTVEKINKVNLKLIQGMRRLNANPFYVTKVDGEAPAATVTNVPVWGPLHPGMVVRLHDRDGLWVVIKDSYDKVSVARLGGDDGRYLRAPRGLATVVSDFTVTEGTS